MVLPNVSAQSLESIGREKPLRITGGISANQIFYAASGIDSRRDPYSYFLSGNLNFDLYGWSVPLSFSFSNQKLSFQQPFNQYGLHPTYKWITGHVGFVSMNFSPYTLSGHLFKGVGVDLAPTEKFSFSAMYGRLQKGVEPDSSAEIAAGQPAFRRMGYGLKAAYTNGGDKAELILFRAKDELNSISYVPEAENILPQENLVLSIAGTKTLFGRLLLSAELAGSGITRDIRSLESGGRPPFGYFGPLYTPRTSSSYYKAFKSGLSYKGNFYTVGLGYERIDPEYQTLGAYYFNNDLENVTVNTTTALFQGRVNISMNVGSQRNNLDEEKISSMRRLVGSANVAWAASERLNLNASYSNFQTFTNIRPQFEQVNQLTPYENLDTLNFTQISQSANLNASYALSTDKERRQNLSMNLSFQDAADKQGNGSMHAGTQFYNVNTSYNINLASSNTGITGAFNYSQNQMDTIATLAVGPTVAVNKSFFEKKLRASLSANMNDSYNTGELLSRVMSLRTNGSYSFMKKHNFNLSLVGLNRRSKRAEGMQSFLEFTATLGYSYNFGK
jgi:hypothetical protein